MAIDLVKRTPEQLKKQAQREEILRLCELYEVDTDIPLSSIMWALEHEINKRSRDFQLLKRQLFITKL